MTYEQQLTFQLRLRGQTENEIAEVLREVRAHPLAGEESMESVFGTAVTYSESFEKKKRRTLGSAIVTVAVLVAVACFITYVVVGLLTRNSGGSDAGINEIIPSWVVSWGSVAFVGIATLTGFLIDFLRPVSVRGATDPT
jgi:hypothetical protein